MPSPVTSNNRIVHRFVYQCPLESCRRPGSVRVQPYAAAISLGPPDIVTVVCKFDARKKTICCFIVHRKFCSAKMSCRCVMDCAMSSVRLLCREPYSCSSRSALQRVPRKTHATVHFFVQPTQPWWYRRRSCRDSCPSAAHRRANNKNAWSPTPGTPTESAPTVCSGLHGGIWTSVSPSLCGASMTWAPQMSNFSRRGDVCGQTITTMTAGYCAYTLGATLCPHRGNTETHIKRLSKDVLRHLIPQFSGEILRSFCRFMDSVDEPEECDAHIRHASVPGVSCAQNDRQYCRYHQM